jgi:hypothetical protein
MVFITSRPHRRSCSRTSDERPNPASGRALFVFGGIVAAFAGASVAGGHGPCGDLLHAAAMLG